MEYKTLLIENKDDIGTIKFNRPEKMNSFTQEMFSEFISALLEIDGDDDLKVLIITGSGRAFSAGLDIVEASKGPTDFDKQVVPLQGTLAWIAQIMRNLKKPIICGINGVAVGAGFSIALASDIRLMAESARIGGPFLKVGLIPEIGSTYNLPRLVGMGKACEIVFTGKLLGATEAKEIGLVNEIVPDHAIYDSSEALAKQIASNAPIPLQLARKALYQGLDVNLTAQIQFEQLCQSTCFKTEDYAEGMKAFLEKRKPDFKGR